MINFIYGISGTGKTTRIAEMIRADIENNIRCFIIVPEQQSVETERQMLSLLPFGDQTDIEVLNFSRLANRVFRTYGGLSYNYIDDSVRSMLMWKAISSVAPGLCEYKGKSLKDPAFIELMLSSVNEFKRNCILPEQLDTVINSVDKSSSLKNKLQDVATIYACYDDIVGNTYDDSSDDLTKLAKLLGEHNFFKGSNVYIDSFSSFTAQEYKIIEKIISDAENFTISLACDAPFSRRIQFESIVNTSKKLKHLAQGKKINDIFLNTVHRIRSYEIKRLAENLWTPKSSVPALPDSYTGESVKIISCLNKYSEAEAAVNFIKRTVMSGARYSDIAIIARDISDYNGILESALEKCQIPFYLSKKNSIGSMPLARALLCVLKIKNNKWRRSDVITFLKAGFCPLSDKEIDMFAEYCDVWNINGSKFTQKPWNMNPDGLSSEISERGKEILEAANHVKSTILPLLKDFFKKLDSAENVTEMCRAIYTFMIDLKVKETLSEAAKAELAAGNKRDADETVRTFNITVDILSKLSDTLGDEKLSCDELLSALKILFEKTDIGTIPTTIDEITIGSANIMRVGNIKHLIIIGANDGVFPRPVQNSGIFTSSEKDILRGLNVTLSKDSELEFSEELLYFYRAICCASESILLTYASNSEDGGERKKSHVLDLITELLPHVKIINYENLEIYDKLWNEELALDYIRSLQSTPEGYALEEYMLKAKEFGRITASAKVPVYDADASVSPSFLQKASKGVISVSQNKLETLDSCTFKYYCRYFLNLRNQKSGDLRQADIGTLIHSVLENFIKSIISDGKLRLPVSEEEICVRLDTAIEQYIKDISFGKESVFPNRIKDQISKARNHLLLILDDMMSKMSDSQFTPSFFELFVGGKDSSMPSVKLTLKDGTPISLVGKIDRIDACHQNNDCYIKIIDYKTGKKHFSKDTDFQLLLYLFSICRNTPDNIKKLFGCGDGGNIIPSEIAYISIDLSDWKIITSDIDTESIRKAALESKLKTSGMSFENDCDIDNTFDSLYEDIIKKIEDYATLLKSGYVSSEEVNPSAKDSPCRNCEMKPICRNIQKSNSTEEESEYDD